MVYRIHYHPYGNKKSYCYNVTFKDYRSALKEAGILYQQGHTGIEILEKKK